MSFFEFCAVVAIAVVITAAALNRFLYYQERAEKASMESTLAAFKSGLQFRLAELLVSNRTNEAVSLETESPVRWLQSSPANYLGSYRAPAAPGNWYFSPATRELIYVANSTNYLEIAGTATAELRFRAKLRYDQVDPQTGQGTHPSGIVLLPTARYRWF